MFQGSQPLEERDYDLARKRAGMTKKEWEDYRLERTRELNIPETSGWPDIIRAGWDAYRKEKAIEFGLPEDASQEEVEKAQAEAWRKKRIIEFKLPENTPLEEVVAIERKEFMNMLEKGELQVYNHLRRN